jgi:hypothetical protein
MQETEGGRGQRAQKKDGGVHYHSGSAHRVTHNRPAVRYLTSPTSSPWVPQGGVDVALCFLVTSILAR